MVDGVIIILEIGSGNPFVNLKKNKRINKTAKNYEIHFLDF